MICEGDVVRILNSGAIYPTYERFLADYEQYDLASQWQRSKNPDKNQKYRVLFVAPHLTWPERIICAITPEPDGGPVFLFEDSGLEQTEPDCGISIFQDAFLALLEAV